MTEQFDVVVVGAGFAGLYAIHTLRQDGFTVRAFETGDGVGGTWYWNRYPGARCDVESIDYQYSFSPELIDEWRWSERYPAQEEILRYLNHVADRFDLRRDISLETTVTATVWDEAAGRWTVETDRGDRVSARYLILASGSLSKAKDPDIPGVASFQGLRLHTSAWPHHEPDLTGRRVAIIGTGSSAIQAIPLLAERAEHLVVLQRTPNYALPAIGDPVSDDEAAARRAGFEARRQRARQAFLGFATPFNDQSALAVDDEARREVFEEFYAMGGLPMYGAFNDLLFDPAANRTVAEFVAEKIRARVADPVIADKLIPTTYPWGTKRVCVENNYYETYNRDNVTLLDIGATPIEEITPSGVRVDGVEHPVDVLIFATGFDALTGAPLRINPVGRDGLTLRQTWTDGAATYLGLTVAGFPNMFLITGPGSPSVFSNMVVSIEQHVEWVTAALVALREAGTPVIEATGEAQLAWTQQCAEIGNASLFPQAQSWYMGANVPGKPRQFLAFLGGVGGYRQICDEVAADGYRGFALSEVPAPALV